MTVLRSLALSAIVMTLPRHLPPRPPITWRWMAMTRTPERKSLPGPRSVTRPQSQAGDVVKVKAGVYQQINQITACRGTAEQPITFEALDGPVTFDGSLPLNDWRTEGGARYSTAVVTKRSTCLGRRPAAAGPQLPRAVRQSGQGHQGHAAPRAVPGGGRPALCTAFRQRDPNRVTMRASMGMRVDAINGAHHLERHRHGLGLNGYKLEAGSSHNLITDAELHHHGQGSWRSASRMPSAAEHVPAAGDPSRWTDEVRTRHLHQRSAHPDSELPFPPHQRRRDPRYPALAKACTTATSSPIRCRCTRPSILPASRRPSRPATTRLRLWGKGEHRVSNNLIAARSARGSTCGAAATRS